jgi:hypothetical protein
MYENIEMILNIYYYLIFNIYLIEETPYGNYFRLDRCYTLHVIQRIYTLQQTIQFY